jgi:hypothetical protein
MPAYKRCGGGARVLITYMMSVQFKQKFRAEAACKLLGLSDISTITIVLA